MRALKRAILIAMLATCALGATNARAAEPPVTVILLGTAGSDSFRIDVNVDGTDFEITSNAPLEVGGKICTHPEGFPQTLLCDAPLISGFEVRTEEGDDTVEVSGSVFVPTTIEGGSGDDRLFGGSGSDWLVGGDGGDQLLGEAGRDKIDAGPGDDVVHGGNLGDSIHGGDGVDSLVGNGGDDRMDGGEGRDLIYGGIGRDYLIGAGKNDYLAGGLGDDKLLGGLGDDVMVGGPGTNVCVGGLGRDQVDGKLVD